MDDLSRLIDLLDAAVAKAAGVVDEERVTRAAEIATRARRRRGYLGDTLLVALAGGTGSGKSSLLNALAGEEVAVVGELRPTTSRPLAWIPADPEPGLTRLLDDLGIDQRIGQMRHPWLAVLDLPDTDSVDVDHRLTVERLLPEIDLVIWVVDPEKYQDAVLHRDFIRPLSAHGDRFWFVLNQADRVRPEQLSGLVEDLARSLDADGVAEPRIVTTAADPGSGVRNIEALEALLREGIDVKRTVASKLATDVREAAEELLEAGLAAHGTGFRERWDEVRRRSAGTIATALAPAALSRMEPSGPALSEGAAQVRELLAETAGSAPRGTADALRSMAQRVDREIGEAAAASLESVGHMSPEPSWGTGARLVRALFSGVALVALVWFAAVVLRGGDPAPAAIVSSAAAAVAVALHLLISSSRRRREQRMLARARDNLAEHVDRELDRRIGTPAREILRERASAASALTELRFELARSEPDGSATTTATRQREAGRG